MKAYSNKIYISGKISGMEEKAKQLFYNAEERLWIKGYDVVNPMNLNHNHDKTWQSFMREDIRALCECDYIYLMPNWWRSKGARIELLIAFLIGIKIKFRL
jgi:hypothetical protein